MRYIQTTKRRHRDVVTSVPSIPYEFAVWLICKVEIGMSSYIGDMACNWLFTKG